MDITGFDVGACGAVIGSIIAAAKGLMSANKAESRAKSIEDDRIATKMKRDEEFRQMQTKLAVLEKENEHLGKRLDEGNNRFERLEKKLDDVVEKQSDTNALLSELIGKVGGGNGK